MVDALAGYIVHIGHSYNSGGASDLLAYVHPYSANPQVVILTSSKRPQSSGILIDDLRITQVGSSHTYYLDIHYSGTAGINTIFLDAIASVQPDVDARSATQIMDLSAVADAPDGEIVIATAEWQSPPMNLGVEYRTTERCNGKPVYVKAVSVSSFPLGGFANRIMVETGISSADVDTVVRWGGYGISGGGNVIALPATFKNDNIIALSGCLYKYSTMVVYIQSADTEDFSAYSGALWLAYTKTTD